MQQFEPRRRSLRLQGYDYSTPGAYFITACTQNRLPLFGQIVDGKMASNRLGAIVEDCWARLPDHYDNVALDSFILMPNHVHGVLTIRDQPTDIGTGFNPCVPATGTSRRHDIPEIMRAFKSFSARRINETRSPNHSPVWQGGFYEHVIRDEDELNRIRTYIMDNPRKWSEDPDNPANWRG